MHGTLGDGPSRTDAAIDFGQSDRS